MRHERPYSSQSHMIFDIRSACVTAEWRQHEGIDGRADSNSKSVWIGLDKADTNTDPYLSNT